MADFRESIWKRLTRLFKSGPVIRHKIAAGEKNFEPKGSASAYKREVSSIYVHSLASYGQYERLARYADYCFHSETLIPTLNGTFSIKELSEKYLPGERFKVWAYDHNKKKVVIADAHSPRIKRNGELTDLIRVNFDDGGFVVVTPDHSFLLRNGEYREAKDLIPNDRLMPFYRKDLSGQGYKWIYTTDRTRSKNGWELEHRLIVEHLLGRELTNEEVVHHIDFNRSNNFPENLLLMDVNDHRSYHANINNRNKKGKSNKKHSLWMQENCPNRRNDITFRAILNAAIICDYKLKKVSSILDADYNVIKKRIRERGFKNWNHFKSRKLDIESSLTLEIVKLESNISFEIIKENHFGCNTIYELCSRIGATEKAIRNALEKNGYSSWVKFKEENDSFYNPKMRYSSSFEELPVNHSVISVEKLDQSQVYNITVEEHHNLAVGTMLENGELSSVFCKQSEMEYTPEIASALDIVADEVTCENEEGNVIEIRSKNEEIKQILETLFFEIWDVNFKLWGLVRTLCKNGDYVLMVDASEGNGVLNLLPIPINEIEREEGYDKHDPFATRFRWTTHGNAILQNWQIVHFRLLGNDQFLPYGVSYLEPARRIWRQLILIEDAMLVYRIVRSPERRVFKIDVGNLPPEEVDRHMEVIKNQLRRNQIVDSTTGRVDLRYNALSVDEDIFIPRRGIQDGTQIDTLPGGQFTGDIEDVQYIQNKVFAALKIPKAYLGYEAELGSKATLAQEDVRFAKTIERIQKLVVAELNKIAIIHLFLLGYEGEDLVDFEISMASPSTVATQQRLELWRMRLEVAQTAGEGVLDKTTIYKSIFGFNDAKIAAVKMGRRADKLEDSLIEGITAEPSGGEGGLPGGEGEAGAEPEAGVPGEEELPKTLGGGTPGTELASHQLSGQVLGEEDKEISEIENPGSEGDDAFIAVDKGKDLFSTGEDLGNLVFGTEKQTASDPFDRRARNRLISRPFSEEIDDKFDEMLENIERLDDNSDDEG